jgi:hypothetical protein
VTTWLASDLEDRLCRALGLAAQVLSDFGTTGYTDATVPQLSFGPEKVVAETAMLVYAASGVCNRPAIRRRVEAVGRQLVPYVRSRRALADTALRPRRAFKYAVPHVLLTSLGHSDNAFDDVFRARCALAVELAGDLPPSARLERHWIENHWESDWRPFTDAQVYETFVNRPIDVLSESRDEAYAHTHLLFYLTDFGRRPPPRLSRPLGTLMSEFEGLLLRYLDLEDYDLSGELLMAWPQLGVSWSPAAAFAFRVLARVEDVVGVLPCGNVDLERLGNLEPHERGRYARASAYHTAFVMGFLCAVSLRCGTVPPTKIDGDQYADSAWEGFLGYIDGYQGHWLEVFAEADGSEKRVLAPLLGNMAIIQKIRQRDYKALHDILVLASSTRMPEHPFLKRAADVLWALDAAMAVVGRDQGGL